MIHNDWPGYGHRKRFAEEQCRHTWMLNLDADEVVPPEARSGDPRSIREGRATRIRMAHRHRGNLPGEAKPHPFAYTHSIPCASNARDRGRYRPPPVHDRWISTPARRPGRLRAKIHHFSVRSLGDQLDKLNRYSDQQADDLEARGVVIPTWRVFVELPGNFLRGLSASRPPATLPAATYGFLTAMNNAISATRIARSITNVARPRDAAGSS